MIRIDVNDAMSGLQRAHAEILQAVESCGQTAVGNMEHYAKEHRPWTDRTGNARRTLEGRLEHSGAQYHLAVVGHMPYSVYLELGFGQRYAILYPTVNALTPGILRGMAGTIAGLK